MGLVFIGVTIVMVLVALLHWPIQGPIPGRLGRRILEPDTSREDTRPWTDWC